MAAILLLQEGGHAVECVEHMIREYRTLFVARKRAAVPPALPAAKPAAKPAALGAASAVAAAIVEPAVVVDTTPATQAETPAVSGSSRALAPLKVSCNGAGCNGNARGSSGQQAGGGHTGGGSVQAHIIDDLPDSPMANADGDGGAMFAEDSTADPALDAAVADLLFSSTCALSDVPTRIRIAEFPEASNCRRSHHGLDDLLGNCCRFIAASSASLL